MIGMICRDVNEMASATAQVLQRFLSEYCATKKISESALKSHLDVKLTPVKGMLEVYEGTNVLMRSAFEKVPTGKASLFIQSVFVYEEEKFPKTLSSALS